ncbi:hypothetical protein PIB30_068125 [Stylosanthes scabra]|uniref:Uncharacterized protein n=1 Tax=Stylosanthes scabra TaxID=79078 RepID=A0ABU6ULK2_9FABA|nr:hypothetical protein [Stylosanthes scabra]
MVFLVEIQLNTQVKQLHLSSFTILSVLLCFYKNREEAEEEEENRETKESWNYNNLIIGALNTKPKDEKKNMECQKTTPRHGKTQRKPRLGVVHFWVKASSPSPNVTPSTKAQAHNLLPKPRFLHVFLKPNVTCMTTQSQASTSAHVWPMSKRGLGVISMSFPHQDKATFGPSSKLGPNVVHQIQAQDLQNFKVQ